MSDGNGALAEEAATGKVETPFLQLVMERLWRATVAAGSHRLTVQTLHDLGGAQQIVENHLLEALGSLDPDDQAAAADLFRFLVSQSKTKIAHSASDLAEWTKRPEPEVAAVLDKLSRGEHGRILRAVPPPADEPDAMRYELFHDVLGEPIFEWRRRYEEATQPEISPCQQVWTAWMGVVRPPPPARSLSSTKVTQNEAVP